MSKVKCICDNVISNVGLPSSSNGWLVTDCDLDAMDDKDINFDDGIYSIVLDCAVDVWECVECGRIGIGNKSDNGIKWFTPESRVCENLL